MPTLLLLGSLLMVPSLVQGQFFSQSLGPALELPNNVTFDEAGSAAKKHLEQFHAFLTNEQWSDAIDTLRLIAEGHADKVLSVAEGRYLSVREYTHLLIADLPPPALALYRQQADPLAKQWYDQGIAQRDERLLRQIVEQWYCSRTADDALFALGEMALERGEFALARHAWEQLLPHKSRPNGPLTRLVYPDTDIDLAAIRARLVLVQLLAENTTGATRELEQFSALHATATGRLGGRSGNYVELLNRLAADIGRSALGARSTEHTTFGGASARQLPIDGVIDLSAMKWMQKLPKPPARNYPWPSGKGVAENPLQPLSYHPVVVGERVFVHTVDGGADQIHAFDLKTGEPAWANNPLDLRGLIGGPLPSSHQNPRLGTQRFTLSAHGNKLFVRTGNPVTCFNERQTAHQGTSSLVCLDLNSEGALLWEITPGDDRAEGDKWAFEGPPLCDGESIYVGMRRSDIRPQAFVASFDARTGKPRWRRFICSSETPGQGQYEEITHNLVTLHGDTVYYNTNQGAIAALSRRDGHVHWIYRYPRAKGGEASDAHLHFYRDLNPCIYDRERLFVAPSDSEQILALDAHTGELLWETGLANNAIHLLGVGQGNLIASGSSVWAFRTDYRADNPQEQSRAGKLVAPQWPPQGQSPFGFGRGVLVGDSIYFPTAEAIHVFDQQTALPLERQPIELLNTRNVRGGHLIVAQQHLLIVTDQQIFAFDQDGAKRD